MPPVSTTPAANFATSFNHTVGKFAAGVKDTGGKTMGLISGCRYLKVNLKAKIYIFITLLSKGVPTKLLKFF